MRIIFIAVIVLLGSSDFALAGKKNHNAQASEQAVQA